MKGGTTIVFGGGDSSNKGLLPCSGTSRSENKREAFLRAVAGGNEMSLSPNSTTNAGEAHMTLSKWIARSGYASRRAAERLVSEKKVQVNGVVASSPLMRLDASAKVLCEGTGIPFSRVNEASER